METFVRGIHRSPVNSPYKGQSHGALLFSLICVWIKDWVNNGEAGDLRRYRAHYDVTIMFNDRKMNSFMVTSKWRNGFRITGPLCWESTGSINVYTNACPSQKDSHANFSFFLCYLPEPNVEKQTVELPLIQAIIPPTWRQCNSRFQKVWVDALIFS